MTAGSSKALKSRLSEVVCADRLIHPDCTGGLRELLTFTKTWKDYLIGISDFARIEKDNFTLRKTLKPNIGASSPLLGGDLVAATAVHPYPYYWERTYAIIEVTSTSTTT